jgi:hypothetical protein
VHPRALTCAARSDEGCRASLACEQEGRCVHDPALGWCVPGSDEDCAEAGLCKGGACRVVRTEVAGWGEVTSCDVGTTPMTSGVDILGFVANPSLLRPPLEVEIVRESISGPLSKKMVGLDQKQIADLRLCLERVEASLSGSPRTLQLDVRVAPGETKPGVFSSVGLGRTARGCILRRSLGWELPAADETSFISVRARGVAVTDERIDAAE